eukprot:943353-Prorocentrum_minimum.AAC.1
MLDSSAVTSFVPPPQRVFLSLGVQAARAAAGGGELPGDADADGPARLAAVVHGGGGGGGSRTG